MARRSKDKNALSAWKMLRIVLGTLHRFTPSWVTVQAILSVFNGFADAFVTTLGIKMIFDAIEAGVSAAYALTLIGIIAMVKAVQQIITQLYYSVYYAKQENKLHRAMQGALFEVALKQDMGAYDDPKFYNDFVWAMQEADQRFRSVMDETQYLVRNTVRLVSAFGVMMSIHWGFLPIIGAGVLLSLLTRKKQIKVNYAARNEEQPFWRARENAARAFYLPEYAKELRLSDVGQALEQDLAGSIDGQKGVYYRRRHMLALLRTVNVMTSEFWIMAASNVLLIYHMTATGLITAGGFAAAQNAVWQVYWGMTNFLYSFTNMSEHALYVQKYLDFLHREPALALGSRPMPQRFESLEVRGVGFRYPAGEEWVLREVSFTVKAGEKIALVGYNGAGKSTLIKLILRLYDPSEGCILLNGVDIREYDIGRYRRFFGALFQDFTLFAATVGENVLAGEDDGSRRDEILRVLDEAGFTEKLAQMDKGIDTPLTREFDEAGQNLSGGEMQKIGIARVLASGGAVWVLDEPSSALDPDSEMQFNRKLMQHSDGKTILFISHRLSTTRMSDRIYMFADGKLVEQGSHNELIEQGGAYAEMFELQAEKYRQGSGNAQ